MELKIAHLVNLILISVFAGTEFAIGFFIHPVLSALPQPVHIASVRAIGRILGKVMPIWIPLIIVSALPVLYFLRAAHILAFWFTIGGVMCIVLMLIVSLFGNVPINNQVIKWDPQSPPANWLKLRKRWDSLHKIRIALDLFALIFFLFGAML